MSQIWAANPHQFGPGKIHIVDDSDNTKTLCGKHLAATPGRIVPGKTGEDATCKICLNAVVNRAKREQWTEESKQRQAEFEQKRAEADAEWWSQYNAYLKTPEWRSRRLRVLARANGICEGCGNAPATQVHHLSYQHVCSEFLWELRAICDDCHERIHGDN